MAFFCLQERRGGRLSARSVRAPGGATIIHFGHGETMKTTLGVLFLGLLVLGGGYFTAADDSARQTKGPKNIPPRIAYKDVVPALIDVVKDRDEDDAVRANAAQALVGLGRHSVPALVELLKSKNNDLRVKAATILANMKAGEAHDAIPVLLQALKNKQEDRDFRRQATFALAQIVAIHR